MIRAKSALTRQVQEFFLEHLVGIVRWDEIEHKPPEKRDPTPNRDARGKRIDKPDGKFRELISMSFGIYDLTVESANDHPPLGWVTFTSRHEPIEGPLERSTWLRIAEQIKLDKETKSWVQPNELPTWT